MTSDCYQYVIIYVCEDKNEERDKNIVQLVFVTKHWDITAA